MGWKISKPHQLVKKLVLAVRRAVQRVFPPPDNGRAHDLPKSPALLGVTALVADELQSIAEPLAPRVGLWELDFFAFPAMAGLIVIR